VHSSTIKKQSRGSNLFGGNWKTRHLRLIDLAASVEGHDEGGGGAPERRLSTFETAASKLTRAAEAAGAAVTQGVDRLTSRTGSVASLAPPILCELRYYETGKKDVLKGTVPVRSGFVLEEVSAEDAKKLKCVPCFLGSSWPSPARSPSLSAPLTLETARPPTGTRPRALP